MTLLCAGCVSVELYDNFPATRGYYQPRISVGHLPLQFRNDAGTELNGYALLHEEMVNDYERGN